MQNGMTDSILTPANISVLEDNFRLFLQDPNALPAEWQTFFRQLESGTPATRTNGNGAGANNGSALATTGKLTAAQSRQFADLQMKALLLIQAYRRHGHFSADNDPLGLKQPNRYGLQLEDHQIGPEDLDKEVSAWIAGRELKTTLRDIIARMEKTYCSAIGTEYWYIRDEERRRWLLEHVESDVHHAPLSHDIKLMIFEKLYHAEYFEQFIARNFPGKKRFSLEGGESLIPALYSVVENAGTYQIRQIVLGMAHRGRLNVLANIMGKDPALIFAEFNEKLDENDDDQPGDVKYHMGYSNDVPTLGGNNVHLSLGFNPSHLEVINPVVLGSVRARQTIHKDHERAHNLPLLIHGDAAFAGQGINYECLNMTNLPGYRVGGTLHIIVNNQIGFTTGAEDSRSTPYCTDLAKILQVPIFHVNGDDPEACYRAIQLCLEWRQKFRTDAFMDLVCYRRLGHNETDEPAFTQPLMYQKIKSKPTTFAIYEQKLLAEGIDAASLNAIKAKAHERFDSALKRLSSEELHIQLEALQGSWRGLKRADGAPTPATNVPREKLEAVATQVTTVPAGFTPNPKIARLLEQRHHMVFDKDGRVDWGMGEMLAYGSLLQEGTSIRLTGQDVKRGTFSHRHAGLFDTQNGQQYIPLTTINPNHSQFEIINSLLSELACVGFEFGYTLADPHTLVIWEAQFGDFVNGAQVMIDQFISSCEAKWNRFSGLVMLLPHGYEGQGPEHSSARPERFLQLCSQQNIQVCNLTTPAQYFHVIRRQMKRNYRKPLIITSPKSLLRLPEASSPLADFINGGFQEVIDERDANIVPEKVKRLVFCTGKIYYELVAERKKRGIENVAVAAIEQLYPYPVNDVASLIQKYGKATEVAWCQEEPRNQGAWIYIENRLQSQLGEKQELKQYTREASPSPATGYMKVHQKEQQSIINRALTV